MQVGGIAEVIVHSCVQECGEVVEGEGDVVLWKEAMEKVHVDQGKVGVLLVESLSGVQIAVGDWCVGEEVVEFDGRCFQGG